MSGGVLALFWLIFLLIAAAWSAAVVPVPFIIRSFVTGEADPGVRARRLMLAASVPWLSSITIMAAVVATAGLKTIGWIADHCLQHGVGHPHLCFAHLPGIELGLFQAGIAALVAVPLLAGTTRLVRAEWRATSELAALKSLADARPGKGRLRVVSVRAPFALAGGLFGPAIVVSRGLLQQLSPRERRVVVAHEAAHLRHGDAWRNVLFELLLIAHPPGVRRRLRTAWQSALEERADDAAARRFGAEGVVATLLRIARLNLHQPGPGFSVAGANLTHRARRLLAGGGGHLAAPPSLEIASVIALTALFTGAVLGHHALETVLGLVVGH